MRIKKKNNVDAQETVSKETKSDIQELFDDLFINQLKRDIAKVDQNVDGVSLNINEAKKQETDIYNIVSCGFSDINDILICLGKPDDWNDINLPSCLNRWMNDILDRLDDIKEKTTYIDENGEENSVFNQVNGVLQATMQNTLEIGNHEKKLNSNSKNLDLIINQLRQLDGIMGKLSNIETRIEDAEKTDDAKERYQQLYQKEDSVIDSIDAYQKNVNHAVEKCNEIHDMLEQYENSYMRSIHETNNGVLTSMNDMKSQILETKECFDTKVNSLSDSLKKKTSLFIMTIGVSIILNICTLITLILR